MCCFRPHVCTSPVYYTLRAPGRTPLNLCGPFVTRDVFWGVFLEDIFCICASASVVSCTFESHSAQVLNVILTAALRRESWEEARGESRVDNGWAEPVPAAARDAACLRPLINSGLSCSIYSCSGCGKYIVLCCCFFSPCVVQFTFQVTPVSFVPFDF